MSRIHEALKQATRGKEPAPLADIATPPGATGANADGRTTAADWLNLNLAPSWVQPIRHLQSFALQITWAIFGRTAPSVPGNLIRHTAFLQERRPRPNAPNSFESSAPSYIRFKRMSRFIHYS